MTLRANKLPSGRWGIFNGERLLATIGDRQTLSLMLNRLSDMRQIKVQIAE